MSEQQHNSRHAEEAWLEDENKISLELVLGDMWKGFLRFGWIVMLVFAVAGAVISTAYTAASFSGDLDLYGKGEHRHVGQR